jgi:hypothetical protein
MLRRFQRRHPTASAVRAELPPLPFGDGQYERCLCAHFVSHLQQQAAEDLVSEAKRVGRELILVEQQPSKNSATEEWQRRTLAGERYVVYKRNYIALDLAVLIQGEVLLDNESFIVARWPPG